MIAAVARWVAEQRLVEFCEEALVAAVEGQGELGDGGVGNGFEGVADADRRQFRSWPSRSMSIWPSRAATRSGAALVAGSRNADRRGLRVAFRAAGLGLGEAEIEPDGHFSPGAEPSANCTRVQGFLMWALSRNSEWRQGDLGRGDVGFAGLGGEGRGEGRVAERAWWSRESLRASLGAKAQGRAAADLEALGERRRAARGPRWRRR